MSVINTMLKKLDARGVPSAHGLAAPQSAASMPLARRRTVSWRLPALVLGAGLAIGLATLADWPALLRNGATLPLRAAQAAPAAETGTPGARTRPPALLAPTAPTAPAAPPAPSALPARTESAGPSTVVASVTPTRPAVIAPAAATSARADASSAISLPASLAAPLALPARIDKHPSAQSPAQRVAGLLRQATELAQAGQRRSALDRAHEALVLDPRNAPTRLLAAVLEHESGASERAAILLREGLEMNPHDAAQALLLARIQVVQGAGSAALDTLDEHGVTGADADGLRGGILAQQGDFKRAQAAYASAAREQPANPMWWFGLGVALESDGQGASARQAYARAQRIGLPRDDLAAYADQRLRAPE